MRTRCRRVAALLVSLAALGCSGEDFAASSGSHDDGGAAADATSDGGGGDASGGSDAGAGAGADAACDPTATASDRANCGACGHACARNEMCSEGVCTGGICQPTDTLVVLRPRATPLQESVAVVPPGAMPDQAMREPGAGDGDTSYMASLPSEGGDARLFVEELTVPAGARITDVAVFVRARSTANDIGQYVILGFYRAAGWPLDDGGQSPYPSWYDSKQLVSKSYGVLAFEAQTRPPATASAWTAADVNATAIYVELDPNGAEGDIHVTQAWVEVCYR